MRVMMAAFRLSRWWIVAGAAALLWGGVSAYQGWASRRPDATATFVAAPVAPGVQGFVTFRDVPGGVWVTVHVGGLPDYDAGPPPVGPHGFHIHEGGSCEAGDGAEPFLAAGGHWNPDDQPHGNHAGDFPVLFSKRGRARMTFFSDRFTSEHIIGRTVIVHLHPDDYRTQPAGDSGLRIACGVIVPATKRKSG